MDEQLSPQIERSFDEEQNPLTDRELASRSHYVPHPEFHFPKANFFVAGIVSGVIGIGLALIMYMGTRFFLFTFMPFDPQARAGLDFLLVLGAILLSIIVESGIALFIAKNKQVISLLLSWVIFFGFIGITAYVISLNTQPL